MNDLIIKGTGNSRYLKSNISPETTLQELIEMLNNGMFPFDFNGLNPAGIEEMGTPLNTATVLKDETAALYGLDGTAVPDDVFKKIPGIATVYLDNFYTAFGIVNAGNISPLSVARYSMAAIAIPGAFAIFAGGYVNTSSGSTNVDAYSPELVRTQPSGLAAAKINSGAALAGNYALFAGTDYRDATVDAYNEDLLHSNPAQLDDGVSDLAAASAGGYALFAGGRRSSSTYSYDIDVYSSDLIHSNTSSVRLGSGTSNLAAGSIGNYAVFAGGRTSSGATANTRAFSSDLVETSMTALSKARMDALAEKAGNYLVISSGSSVIVADAYSTDLVHVNVAEGSLAPGASTSLNGYALFSNAQELDAYDSELILTTPTMLSAAVQGPAAATIGESALFAGEADEVGVVNNITEGYEVQFTIPKFTRYKFNSYHDVPQTTLVDIEWKSVSPSSGLFGYMQIGGFTLSGLFNG